MRVIAGSARRLILVAPRGDETRPTSDKTKETLFNCLMSYVEGASFLDLFSGSGAIGIEALSRGAASCVFVEKSKEALDCIKKNLGTTHFTEKAIIEKGDVLGLIARLESKGPFDIIFMDPPFNKELEKSVLNMISRTKLLNEDGIIVVEASNDTDFSYLEALCYEIFKIKQYKTHQHVFIRKNEARI